VRSQLIAGGVQRAESPESTGEFERSSRGRCAAAAAMRVLLDRGGTNGMTDERYDYVVIGSGFGGSITASRLAQAGNSV